MTFSVWTHVCDRSWTGTPQCRDFHLVGPASRLAVSFFIQAHDGFSYPREYLEIRHGNDGPVWDNGIAPPCSKHRPKDTTMSNTHSIWVSNTSPEWLASNAGIPDMVLGQADHYNANFMALRLQRLIPGLDVTVKDDRGIDVGLVPEEDAYRVLVENPRRDSVGLPPRP